MSNEALLRRRVFEHERQLLLASLLGEDDQLSAATPLPDREKRLENHLLDFCVTHNENQDRKGSKIAEKDSKRLLSTLRSDKDDSIDTFLRQYRHLVRARDGQAYENAQKEDVEWLRQQDGFERLAEEINTANVFGAIRNLFRRRYLRLIRRHYPVHRNIGAEDRKKAVDLLQKLYVEDLVTFRQFLTGFAAIVEEKCNGKHDLAPHHCVGLLSLSAQNQHLTEFANDVDDFVRNISDLVGVTAPISGQEAQHSGVVNTNANELATVSEMESRGQQGRKGRVLHTAGITPRLTRGATAKAQELLAQSMLPGNKETDTADAFIARAQDEDRDLQGQKNTPELEITSAGRSDKLVEEYSSDAEGSMASPDDSNGGSSLTGEASLDKTPNATRSASKTDATQEAKMESSVHLRPALRQTAGLDEEESRLNVSKQPNSHSNEVEKAAESETTTSRQPWQAQGHNEIEMETTDIQDLDEVNMIPLEQQLPSADDQDLPTAQVREFVTEDGEMMDAAPMNQPQPVTADLGTTENGMAAPVSSDASNIPNIEGPVPGRRAGRGGAGPGDAGTSSGPGRNTRSKSGKLAVANANANANAIKKSSAGGIVKSGGVSRRKVEGKASETRIKTLEKAIERAEGAKEEAAMEYESDAMDVEVTPSDQHIQMHSNVPQTDISDMVGNIPASAPIPATDGGNYASRLRSGPAGKKTKNDTKTTKGNGKLKTGAKRIRTSAEESRILKEAAAKAKRAERVRHREAAKRKETTEKDEPDRYVELSKALNDHLATTISDSLPIDEKQPPDHFAHLPRMIEEEVHVKTKRPLKLASYFMAISLLLHSKKIEPSQLPKSAEQILQPLRDLLRTKHYQPCVHPDLSCHKMECYEQWYTLCVNAPNISCEEAAAKWKVTSQASEYSGKECNYNARFRSHFETKMRIFSAREEYRWSLRYSLGTSWDELVGQSEDTEAGTVVDTAMDLDEEHHTATPRVGQRREANALKRKRSGDDQESTTLTNDDERGIEGLQALETKIAVCQVTYDDLQKDIQLLKDEKKSLEEKNAELRKDDENLKEEDLKPQQTKNQNSDSTPNIQAPTITQLVSNIINDIKEKDELGGNQSRARETLKDQFMSLEDGEAIFDIYCVLYDDLPSTKLNLDQECKKTVKAVVSVMRQYFISLNGETSNIEQEVLGSQLADLNNKSTWAQMEAYFSARFRDTFTDNANGSFYYDQTFKDIVTSMGTTWENARKEKADLEKEVQASSKLKKERDGFEEKLKLTKEPQSDKEDKNAIELLTLQQDLEKAQAKAEQASAVAEKNKKWYHVAQLSLVMLRTYLEPRVLGEGIDDSKCKSIRKYLVDGDLADIAVVNQLHVMLCRDHCTRFSVTDGNPNGATCEKSFQDVLPEKLSQNSLGSVLCSSILSGMERAVSKHNEAVTQPAGSPAKIESGHSASESSTEDVKKLNERYELLQKKFELAADENESTLDFVGWLLGCSLTNKRPSPKFKPEETCLKEGNWANANVIQCLHTILSSSCPCGAKWATTLDEKTYRRDMFRECSQQFQNSLPDKIQANIGSQYVPGYNVLSVMAEAKTLQKEMEDSHRQDQIAKDEEQKLRTAAGKEESRKACLGTVRLIEQQLKHSLNGEDNKSSAENLRNLLSQLEVSSPAANAACHEELILFLVELEGASISDKTSEEPSMQLLHHLNQVQSIKSELEKKKKSQEQNEVDEKDLIQSWEACQMKAKCVEQSWTLRKIRSYIIDHEVAIISLASNTAHTSSGGSTKANAPELQAPQHPVVHAETQTSSNETHDHQLHKDYEKAVRQVEITEKLLGQAINTRIARHQLLQELAKCLEGSPPQVEMITKYIQISDLDSEESLNELHRTLSCSHVAERVGVRQCSDSSCMAPYLHGLVPTTSLKKDDYTASTPASTPRRDVEEFFTLLKQMKEIIKSKKSMGTSLFHEKEISKMWRWRYLMVGRLMVRRLRSIKAQLQQKSIEVEEQKAELGVEAEATKAAKETISRLHNNYMQTWKKLCTDAEQFSDEPSNDNASLSMRVQSLVENAKLVTRTEMEKGNESRVSTWLYILTSNVEAIRKWDKTSPYNREQRQVCDQAEQGGLSRTVVSDCLNNAASGGWRSWYEKDGGGNDPHDGNEQTNDNIVALYGKMERVLTIGVGIYLEWAAQRVDKLAVCPDTLPPASHSPPPGSGVADKSPRVESPGVYISKTEYARLQKLEIVQKLGIAEKQLVKEIEQAEPKKSAAMATEDYARKRLLQELQQRYGLTYFKCLRELREKDLIAADRHYDLEREIMQYRQYYCLLAMSYFAVEVDDEWKIKTCKPRVDEATALEWAKLGGLDDDTFSSYMAMANSGAWEELAKREDTADKTVNRKNRINQQSEYLVRWIITTQGLSVERGEQLQDCSKQINKLWKTCELSHGWADFRSEFAELGNRGKGGTSSPAKQLAFIMERLGQEDPVSRKQNIDTTLNFAEGAGVNGLHIDSQEETSNTVNADGDGPAPNTANASNTPQTARSLSNTHDKTVNLGKRRELKEILAKSASLVPARREPPKAYNDGPSGNAIDIFAIPIPEGHRVMTLLLIMDAKMMIETEKADAELEEVFTSARLGGLYCGEFLSCLRAGGFSMRKADNGKGPMPTTEEWLRYKIVVENIVSTKRQIREQQLLQEGCSEHILYLYELHGGSPQSFDSNDVDDNSVELISTGEDVTLSRSADAICNKDYPLDLRLQALVYFVSKAVNNSTSNHVQLDVVRNVVRDAVPTEGQTWSWNDLDAYSNGSLQNTVIEIVQSSCQELGIVLSRTAAEEAANRRLISLSSPVTPGGFDDIGKLYGHPLKIKEIKAHHPGYQLLIVDHNNHPHPKFQQRTALGTILEAGSTGEAEKNAAYFYGVFSRALTGTLTNAERNISFEFLRGVEKVVQLPACIRFQKILTPDTESHPVAKGCSHVLHRDGEKQWNVEHRTMKRWGKHVRKALIEAGKGV